EWGVAEGQVWLFQVDQRKAAPGHRPAMAGLEIYAYPEMAELARLVARWPGPIGKAFILPWAIAGLPDVTVRSEAPGDMTEMYRLRDELVAEVWQIDAASGLERALRTFQTLRGPTPSLSLPVISGLQIPSRES